MPPANRSRLFLASRVALIVTAMSFAIRGDTMDAMGARFSLNNEQLGWIAGTAFWGFTLAMLIGGPLCDVLGMKRIMIAAFVCHLGGILTTCLAQGFWSLYAGTLLMGIGNGSVEAACNPLIATMYPEEKTKRLNQFHVWFPGGIVIGGLVSYGLSQLSDSMHLNLSWRVKVVTMIVPLVIYGLMFLKQSMPKTERLEAGVAASTMFKCCLQPLFLLMVACMVLTASTELGPNQWIPAIFQKSADVSGILVLVWINGLMAIGRQFAGPMVHRLAPNGMLLFSAIFAALGLWCLSAAQNGVETFGAATVFAVGVCYFWPTMIGFTSERCPRTGALGLALMGGTGMLAANFALPFIGHVLDKADGPTALRDVSVLPVVLIFVFGALWLADRARGGYKAEKIGN